MVHAMLDSDVSYQLYYQKAVRHASSELEVNLNSGKRESFSYLMTLMSMNLATYLKFMTELYLYSIFGILRSWLKKGMQ